MNTGLKMTILGYLATMFTIGVNEMWHFWFVLSLATLGVLPIILWIMMDNTVMITDFIYSILITYLVYRWLLFDMLMNERLEMPITYIGTTAFYAKILHRIFPKQDPQGYLWIRLLAFFAWNVVWYFRWIPGSHFKPVNIW